MSDPLLSPTSQALLARLSDIARQPDQRIFAVMDGARFENLPILLRQMDAAHRPLYRHAGGDYSIVVGGPWLVDPSRPAAPMFEAAGTDAAQAEDGDAPIEVLEERTKILSAQMMAALEGGDPTGGGILPGNIHSDADAVTRRLEKIIEAADGKAGVVFWIGKEALTEENLNRHLRSINRILIPKTAVSNEFAGGQAELTAAADEGVEKPAYAEMVIFRHADPNVMIQVFPCMDEDRGARLFGPATEILFAPDPAWGGGIKRGRRPVGITTPPGHLRLLDEDISQIRSRRLKAMREMRIAYLRKCCPDELGVVPRDVLAKHVLASEVTGTQLGLISEAAHCRWAYLMFATRGQIAASPDVVNYIRDGGSSPDRQVVLVMKSTVAELRRQRAEFGIDA